MAEGIEGKVIVITGASSGIGACLAKLLHKNGAKVVLAARRLEELQNVANECGNDSNVLIQQCDVTKRADHEALRDVTLERFQRVDCWINNAGVGLSKTVLEITDEDVDQMISINTKSVLYGMQTIVPYFKERNAGQVINVSSMLGRTPFASIRAMYRYDSPLL
jgi:NADP-dependent 3-hydroxy acid dehydrogenase YdfG